MLRILIIFLILVAGMVIGPMLASHQGMALFQISNYRIKMSITTFVVLEILFILLLYISYWVIKKISYPKTALGNWLQARSLKKSAKRIEQAQLLLLEGNYKKAGKLLSKSAKTATNTALTYLQAAQAEINNNRFSVAKEYLAEATKTCQDKEKFAFRLIQLRLQIKSQQYRLARIGVEKLLEEKPRHQEVLRLAYQLYNVTQEYQSIIDILPIMYKAEAFNETQLDQFKDIAYIARIKQLAGNEIPSDLMTWWKKQPRSIRNNPTYQKAVEISQNNVLPK